MEISRFSTHPVTGSAFHQAEYIEVRNPNIDWQLLGREQTIPQQLWQMNGKIHWIFSLCFFEGQKCGTMGHWLCEQDIEVTSLSIWKYKYSPKTCEHWKVSAVFYACYEAMTWSWLVPLLLLRPPSCHDVRRARDGHLWPWAEKKAVLRHFSQFWIGGVRLPFWGLDSTLW